MNKRYYLYGKAGCYLGNWKNMAMMEDYIKYMKRVVRDQRFVDFEIEVAFMIRRRYKVGTWK